MSTQWDRKVIQCLFLVACLVDVAVTLSCYSLGGAVGAPGGDTISACASAGYTNAAFSGGGIVNISLAAMQNGSPSSVVVIAIAKATISNNTILAIDATGLTATALSTIVSLSIILTGIVASSGGLLFRGAFPNQTTIYITKCTLNVNNGGPLFNGIDTTFTSYSKSVVLSNVALNGGSSFIMDNVSLVPSVPGSTTNNNAIALLILGSAFSLTNNSTCIMRQVVCETGSFPFVVQSATITISSNSSWLIGQSSFLSRSTSAVNFGNAFFIRQCTVQLVGSSSWFLQSVNMTSGATNAASGYDTMSFSSASVYVTFGSVLLFQQVLSLCTSGSALMMSTRANFVNVTQNSSWIILASNFTSTSTTAANMNPSVLISDTSTWRLEDTVILARPIAGSVSALQLPASVRVTNSSFWIMNRCTLETGVYIALVPPTQILLSASGVWFIVGSVFRTLSTKNAADFYLSNILVSNWSGWIIRSSSFIADANSTCGNGLILGGSTIVFSDRSLWALTNSYFSAYDQYAFSLYNSDLNVTAQSAFVLISNTLRTLGSNNPILWTWAVNLAGASWMLLLNNSINTTSATSCILLSTGVSLASQSVVSVLENNCTGSATSIWSGPAFAASTGTDIVTFFIRCNLLKGLPSSANFPAAAQNTTNRACFSCNISADCFSPFTSVAASAAYVAPFNCPCQQAGAVSSSLCLPFDVYSAPPPPPTTLTPSTAVPTTLAPTTAAPSTSTPTTAVPSTLTPSTAVPSTAVPTTTAIPTTSVLPTSTVAPTTPTTTSTPATTTPAALTTNAPTTTAPTTSTQTIVPPTTSTLMTTPTATSTTSSPATTAALPLSTTLDPSTAAPTSLEPSTAAAATTGVPAIVPSNTSAPAVTGAPPTATSFPSTSAPGVDLCSSGLSNLCRVSSSANLSFTSFFSPVNDTSASTGAYQFVVSYDAFSQMGALNVSLNISLALQNLSSAAVYSAAPDPSSVAILRSGALLPLVIFPSVASRSTAVTMTFTFDSAIVLQKSDTVVSVIFPRPLFPCPMLGPLTVTLRVQPAADSAGTALTKVTGQLAVASAVSFNPTAAVQMARINALQDISMCIFSSTDEVLRFADGSFAPMQIGTAPGKYVRGALVGNAIVVIVGSLVLALCASMWMFSEHLKLGNLKKVVGLRELADRAMQKGRIPSVYLPVYFVMGTPSIGFAISLFSYDSPDAATVLIGLISLLLLLSYAIAVTHTLTREFCCRIVHRREFENNNEDDDGGGGREGERRERQTAIGKFFKWWCEGELRWVANGDDDTTSSAAVDDAKAAAAAPGNDYKLSSDIDGDSMSAALLPSSSAKAVDATTSGTPRSFASSSSSSSSDAWRRKNRLYFDDYKLQWYGLVDLWSTVVLGIINGIRVSSKAVCAAQLAALLGLFALVFFMAIYFNPALSRSLRYYVHFSNLIALSSCILQLAAIRLASDDCANYAGWLSFFGNFVSLLKLAVDILHVLYRFISSIGVSTLPVTNSKVMMTVKETAVGGLASPDTVDSFTQGERPSLGPETLLVVSKVDPQQQTAQEVVVLLTSDDDDDDFAVGKDLLPQRKHHHPGVELDVSAEALLRSRAELKSTTIVSTKRVGENGEFDVFNMHADTKDLILELAAQADEDGGEEGPRALLRPSDDFEL